VERRSIHNKQVIKLVIAYVTDIQNASLGEHRIRDINDEINKLLKEKEQWEIRIRELGGKDYTKETPVIPDIDESEVPSIGGYKYFGAAKQLPMVREIFKKQTPNPPKKDTSNLYKRVSIEYYGFGIEDEEALRMEKELELRLQVNAIKDWEENKGSKKIKLENNKP
jgi:pre-mRNA-splicing factor ISY1